MENLILWGVPVIGALIGLGSRLFKSYTSLLNFAFAVYLSIWTESMFSSLFRVPGNAAPYKSAVTMLFCAILAWVLLMKLTDQLMPEEREFVFPPLLDKLGGGFCGFLAGMVLINFAAFLLCATPQKTIVTGFVSLPALERASAGNLVSFTHLIDSVTFQKYSRGQRAETLERLIRQADPPPPPEEEQPPSVPANLRNTASPRR